MTLGGKTPNEVYYGLRVREPSTTHRTTGALATRITLCQAVGAGGW